MHKFLQFNGVVYAGKTKWTQDYWIWLRKIEFPISIDKEVLDELVDSMTYVIAEPCEGCKDAACLAVCPCDCIATTDEDAMYYINPEECIWCGACAAVCPVDAIFPDDDLPDPWFHYREVNAEFFRR